MSTLQVLLEMSPGMGVDKYVYSSSDLKSHNAHPHTWGPADLVRKLMSDQGFDAVLENPTSGALETLSQLVCFGSTEVSVLFFQPLCGNQAVFFGPVI